MAEEKKKTAKKRRDMTLVEMREHIRTIRKKLVTLHRTGHALVPADAAIIIWDKVAHPEAPDDLAKRWECAIDDVTRIEEILDRWLSGHDAGTDA